MKGLINLLSVRLQKFEQFREENQPSVIMVSHKQINKKNFFKNSCFFKMHKILCYSFLLPLSLTDHYP